MTGFFWYATVLEIRTQITEVDYLHIPIVKEYGVSLMPIHKLTNGTIKGKD